MNESEVSNVLRKVLLHNGCYAIKVHQTVYNTAGIPDILCCYEGKFIGIEMKVHNGGKLKYTDHQKTNLQNIRAAGGIGVGVTYRPVGPTDTRWALDEKITGETVHLTWCSLASLVERVLTLPIHQS